MYSVEQYIHFLFANKIMNLYKPKWRFNIYLQVLGKEHVHVMGSVSVYVLNLVYCTLDPHVIVALIIILVWTTLDSKAM